MTNKKVLIIRFSSIGDIVLTSPVVRSLKKAHPDCNIHYLSKSANKDLLLFNPYLDKIQLLKDSLSETIKELKAEKFDYILDLHHNTRSFLVKMRLGVPSKSFPKENFSKFRMVHFKNREIKLEHIVSRYGTTLSLVHTQLDHEGLDFFLPESKELEAKKQVAEKVKAWKKKPIAVVLGAKHATKRWIPEYFVELLNARKEPVILIGGPDAIEESKFIQAKLTVPFWDTVAQFPLLEAAALMKQCRAVLTHDTGFMHIAAAFRMQVFSIWGNTVPEFGMTPYKTDHIIIEQKDLACRPCSKIGYDKCPKGHFRCMREISPKAVADYMS